MEGQINNLRRSQSYCIIHTYSTHSSLGFLVADYIKYLSYPSNQVLKLSIFYNFPHYSPNYQIIPNHPVNVSCGKKPENPKKPRTTGTSTSGALTNSSYVWSDVNLIPWLEPLISVISMFLRQLQLGHWSPDSLSLLRSKVWILLLDIWSCVGTDC